MGLNVLLMGGISAVMAIESDPDAPHEWVAAGLLVTLQPAVVVIGTLQKPPTELTYLPAADAAYQVAADVQHTTTVTADYNGFAKWVYRMHTDAVALSEKMTPVIFGYASTQCFGMLMFLFVAVGPRPPRGDRLVRNEQLVQFLHARRVRRCCHCDNFRRADRVGSVRSDQGDLRVPEDRIRRPRW